MDNEKDNYGQKKVQKQIDGKNERGRERDMRERVKTRNTNYGKKLNKRLMPN